MRPQEVCVGGSRRPDCELGHRAKFVALPRDRVIAMEGVIPGKLGIPAYPKCMKSFAAEFLNVDLDLKSRTDPTALLRAWGSRMLTTHLSKSGGRHWLRSNLTFQPTGPGEAIRRFAKLTSTLPLPARRVWSLASKEIDIGLQAGFERGSGEWVLDASVVRILADLGVRVRITVYSPLLLTEQVPRKGSSRD